MANRLSFGEWFTRVKLLVLISGGDRALEAILILSIKSFKFVVDQAKEEVNLKIVPHLRSAGVTPSDLLLLLSAKRSVEDCIFTGRALQSAIAAVLGEGGPLPPPPST